MANYVIEGTVFELTKEKSKVSVKIVGSEGYAIKHDDKIYNVFCLENMPETDDAVKSYITDSKTKITVNKEFETILTQASMHGKKIRLTVSESALKNTKGKTVVDITSVTLLQK